MNDTRSATSMTTAEDATRRAARTIRADVRALSAYHVAKAGGLVKLDAMENPYPLPAALRERLAGVLADVPVNRYPDGAAERVKLALRRALELPDDAAIVLGNGSDELIQLFTTAIAAPGACVLAPEPSFVMYRLNALYANVRYVGVPLGPAFSLDVEAMLEAVASQRPALVWLAYPNNPTGNRFAPAAIERIVEDAPGLVVVDEAYYAFADDSFITRALEFPNLVVMRTVSKIGMAGLRLGYAVGHAAWIDEIDKVRPPYNVNALTQAAVPLLLEAGDALAEQAAAIRSERARLGAALARCRGAVVYPSETNFVLVGVPDAVAWFRTLLDAGILVKNLHGWHPLLDNCLRITVGTPSENDRVIEALSVLP
jgi:histidinol-phosphate aminotransferase